MPYFVARIFLDLKREVNRREYGFSIKSKTSFMSSCDKPFFNFEDSSQRFLQIPVVNVQRVIFYK